MCVARDTTIGIRPERDEPMTWWSHGRAGVRCRSQQPKVDETGDDRGAMLWKGQGCGMGGLT
jgi:hypothetical protein